MKLKTLFSVVGLSVILAFNSINAQEITYYSVMQAMESEINSDNPPSAEQLRQMTVPELQKALRDERFKAQNTLNNAAEISSKLRSEFYYDVSALSHLGNTRTFYVMKKAYVINLYKNEINSRK